MPPRVMSSMTSSSPDTPSPSSTRLTKCSPSTTASPPRSSTSSSTTTSSTAWDRRPTRQPRRSSMNEKARAERILTNMAGVGEDLLALVDEVGHSINFNDRASLEAGTKFLDTYNQKLDAFQALSTELAALIRQKYGISIEEQPGNKSGTEARIPVGSQ